MRPSPRHEGPDRSQIARVEVVAARLGGAGAEAALAPADSNRLTAADKGPSASLPPRSSLRRGRATPPSSLVGASHLDPSRRPVSAFDSAASLRSLLSYTSTRRRAKRWRLIERAYRGDETGPDPRKRGGPTEAYSYTPQGEPERADDGDGPVSSARRQPVDQLKRLMAPAASKLNGVASRRMVRSERLLSSGT